MPSSSEYDITPKMSRREEALEKEYTDYYRPRGNRSHDRKHWDSDDESRAANSLPCGRRGHSHVSTSQRGDNAGRQQDHRCSRSPSRDRSVRSFRGVARSSRRGSGSNDKRHRRCNRSRSRSRSPDRHRDEERREHRHRRKHRDDTPPSDSDSSHHRRRRREEREERRKAERAERKRHKERRDSSSTVDVGRSKVSWGKYGLIDPTDMARKAEEFRAWLVEERGLNPDWITRDKSKKEFKVFIEDYNTGTLSHDKYYDMAKYRFNMEIIKSGHTLPVEEGSYDPSADLKAHNRRVKAEKRKERVLSREEIEELRQVEKERVEIGRMRLLGIEVPREMGVRADWVKVDAVNYNENKPW